MRKLTGVRRLGTRRGKSHVYPGYRRPGLARLRTTCWARAGWPSTGLDTFSCFVQRTHEPSDSLSHYKPYKRLSFRGGPSSEAADPWRHSDRSPQKHRLESPIGKEGRQGPAGHSGTGTFTCCTSARHSVKSLFSAEDPR